MTLHLWRQAAEAARDTPGSYGLRPFRVYTIVREWSGEHVGDGVADDDSTELLESGYPPKVRELAGDELAVNGLAAGTIEVGPFTPSWTVGATSGGVALSTLVPTASGGNQELLYRVTGTGFGDYGKLYALSRSTKTANFRYTLTLTPIETGE